ncbi:hypothetical protein BKA57DRAFT_80328 [Linnemannia elongata]|nr:hypothetical protein BKA57DRAFT_80328 [Linnemannia elongata]
MEATATPYSNGTTAETSPPLEDARDNNNNEPIPTAGTDTATPPTTQSHFEGRGNLDTLVAAALKPLVANEDYPQRHHSPPQRHEPPGHSHFISNNASDNARGIVGSDNSGGLNDRNKHTSSTPHIPHHRGSPSRSPHHADNSLSAIGGSVLDPSYLQTTSSSLETLEATSTTTAHSHHEHSSSKYHYREQGRAISDEDSEEDPSPASRQHNRHTRPEAPSEYPSRSSHALQEQSDSAFKSNARSSMSISSLLGDSSGYARRTAGDEEDSTPDHHAKTRHLTPSPVVRPNGAQSEGLFEQTCTEMVAKRKLIRMTKNRKMVGRSGKEKVEFCPCRVCFILKVYKQTRE